MAESPAPAVYTVAEVAALLRRGRRQTYEDIRRGDIPCLKLGGSVRCSKIAIHQWLDATEPNARLNGQIGGDGRDLGRNDGRTSLEEVVART